MGLYDIFAVLLLAYRQGTRSAEYSLLIGIGTAGNGSICRARICGRKITGADSLYVPALTYTVTAPARFLTSARAASKLASGASRVPEFVSLPSMEMYKS